MYDELAEEAKRDAQINTEARNRVRGVEGPSKAGSAEMPFIGGGSSPMPSARQGSDGLTLDNVDDAFTNQLWEYDQLQAGTIVRESLVAAAKAILRHVPPCPARTIALNHLQSARMDANRAITWRGRF